MSRIRLVVESLMRVFFHPFLLIISWFTRSINQCVDYFLSLIIANVLPRILCIVNDFLCNAVKYILPIIALCCLSGIFLVNSIFISISLRYFLIPKAIISEPVHFNYDSPNPIARLNILTYQRQWEYIGENHPFKADQLRAFNRYLQAGTKYSFELHATLAWSRRNIDLGTFMIYLTLFDNSGYALAKSSRPISLPYQSVTSLFIDSIVKYPLRLFGFVGSTESVYIPIQLMNDYDEPRRSFPPTEHIEIALSTANVDILDCSITVLPKLTGFT